MGNKFFIKTVFLFFLLSTQYMSSQIDSLLTLVDHANPKGEKFYLKYEFGAKYNPKLPTVFAIADGQQFWARKGRAKRFQEDVFGENFNVVVVFSRAMNNSFKFLAKTKISKINWQQAYNIFKSYQWIEDIESVRKAINPNKKINLYGRSGGGLLLLQYLEKYSQHVDKAFCQTAPVPELEKLLGFRHDKIWEELISYDIELTIKLKKSIDEKYFNKEDIFLCLQRQNFFVKVEDINIERKKLIDVIYNKNTVAFGKFKKKYQVDIMKRMMLTTPGISSAVRQYEFFMLDNYYELLKSNNKGVRPNIEAIKIYANPLIDQYEKRKIPRPKTDFHKLRNIKTQVMIFAGRWDHTVDYRGQYYLHGLLPNSVLFLADDNHVFSSIYDTGNYSKIVQGALSFDINSKYYKNLMKRNEKLIWNEWK